MNVTLTLDEELVRRLRKIAIDRDTTLTGMIREYLETLASEDAVSGRQRREREALERSFKRISFRMGKPSWKRADLYDRS